MWIVLILTALISIPVVNEWNRRAMDDAGRGGAPGKFAALSRGTTHYDWLGPPRGPVAVCVHGLTTPSFVYRGLARGLAMIGFRVLLYDLYGRGFSDRPKDPQNAAFFVTQLEELLAHQDVEGEITLIGYSMGGAIATCFAAALPERVRRLILIAPAGMGVDPGKGAKFIANTPIIGDWLMLAIYPLRMRRELRQERGLPTSVPDINDLQERELDFRGFIPAVLSSFRGILSAPLQAEHFRLHQTDMPILAIWGGDDDVIPASAIGKLGEWSRDAKQEVIEDAGHGLTYTHTDEILQIITEWLQEDVDQM